MNRRRALAALTGLAALPLLTACPGGNQPVSNQQHDKPDCDLGDMLEGDKDCDPKPATSPTTKKPTPRQTRRS